MGETNLSLIIPSVFKRDEKLIQANTFLKGVYDGGFSGFAKAKGYNLESKMQPLGIEQLYFEWLRTAYAYRRMFIQDLYLLAFDSSEIRSCFQQLKNQVFKKGFDDWKPVFKKKCMNCDKEFQQKADVCDKCGSTELREPDPDQYERFEKFKLNSNVFGQDLESMLRTTEDDVNIVDDAYLFLNSTYEKSGKKVWRRVEEIRRIHPALIEFDLDKAGLPENSHWICLFHRDEISAKPMVCPTCNTKMKPVMYVYNHRGRRIFLPKEELLHFSKFSESETYGYSMLLTVMQKVLTLQGMDRFLYRYFFERKVPTGLILTNTDDPQSLEIERNRIEARMMEDPTYIPWIAVSNRTGRGRTDFVRLFHTLHEMDYLPVRNEIRDRIGAAYGVPQIYMNVMEGVGGISGQTQQLKLFSDVIQSDQRRFNTKIIREILKAFDVTDWKLELRPPEEKVEGEILQLAQMKVMIATQMSTLGFEVELKPECNEMNTLDFNFSGKAMTMQEKMGGGGAPGGLAAGGAGGAGGMGAGAGMPAGLGNNMDSTASGVGAFNSPQGQRKEDEVFQDKELQDLLGSEPDADAEDDVFKPD